MTTEREDYSFAGLDIASCRVNQHRSGRLTWSEVVILALEHCVATDLVLFMLDDFFISGPVDQPTIERCADLMNKHDHSCITLTNHDRKRTYRPTENPLLSRIDDFSPYRVTTSPSLWKKEALLRYLKPVENAWMFEKFGTRRSYRIKDSFYRVNESALRQDHDEVIPYFWTQEADTGIVKGKWQAGIEELFNRVGIKVDYSVRGYYRRLPWVLNKLYLAQKMLENPGATIAGLLGRP
ncbi:MAG: hypothetical protein KKC30_13020 [Proteobacteria bacterium]|nr:hypothetical protein [Pseudomonadota bacterium]MBU4384629.1 hypothetical protein [Pseudomonadota bacterium]MBU4606760.1 hypothetical protein [Pseudomonadota bacterium]MCG2766223.1 hypothetical protein [Desulfarculaceae bacterium]